MNFITNNLPTISLILISLFALAASVPRQCTGANNTNPECRYSNLVGPGGLCVIAHGNGDLKQGACSNNDAALWNISEWISGQFLISSKTGKVMDNSGSGTNNGNHTYGWTLHSKKNQLWSIRKISATKVSIKNYQSNKCFDNTGNVKTGHNYHQWSCDNGNKNQHFEFRIPTANGDNGFVNIVTPTGLCVSDKNANAGLVQEKCSGSNNMLWSFVPSYGGIRVVSKNGRFLDNRSGSNKNGSETLGWKRNSTTNQIWRIEWLNNGGSYHFINPAVNKCFDDTGAPGVGKGFHQWTCSAANKNQWFKIQPYVAPAAPVTPVVTEPLAPAPTTTDPSDIDDKIERNHGSRRKMRKGY
jgi:hypothetical protein